MYRVNVGAALSMIDAATDIYVIATYYQSEELIGKAHALIVMISTNMIMQIFCVLTQYQKKTRTVKAKEALITFFFLRPVVDAYRVSANQEDEEHSMDRLAEVSERSEKPVNLRTPRRCNHIVTRNSEQQLLHSSLSDEIRTPRRGQPGGYVVTEIAKLFVTSLFAWLREHPLQASSLRS